MFTRKYKKRIAELEVQVADLTAERDLLKRVLDDLPRRDKNGRFVKRVNKKEHERN